MVREDPKEELGLPAKVCRELCQIFSINQENLIMINTYVPNSSKDRIKSKNRH